MRDVPATSDCVLCAPARAESLVSLGPSSRTAGWLEADPVAACPVVNLMALGPSHKIKV